MTERVRVVLSDLGAQLVNEEEILELLRSAEPGTWIRTDCRGDGTWTVYLGIARGCQWPENE